MANRISIDDFTEAEREIIQSVYKNGIEESSADAIELYVEWENALAYAKAISDEKNSLIKAELEESRKTYQAMVDSAISAMEALKAEALARLEVARESAK